MKDLPLRTAMAIVLLGLLALVLWLGGWIQAIMLGILSLMAICEMNDIFKAKGLSPFVVPQMILGALQFTVLFKLNSKWLFALSVLTFSAIIIERIINKKRTNYDLIASVSLLIYPLSCLLCLGAVGFGRTDYSRIALFCCFAGPCMADNSAYMVGSMFGKHKLCPDISPNKTVEGAISGVIGGALGGILAYFVQRLWGFNIPLLTLVLICLLGGMIGQFGDLLSSTYKRWAGVKDFGNIFPGHGGVMDRLDSAMIAAPIVLSIFMLFIK